MIELKPASFSWPHENGMSSRGHENGGETAAKTPFDCMHKLVNACAITDTELGGLDGKRARA